MRASDTAQSSNQLQCYNNEATEHSSKQEKTYPYHAEIDDFTADAKTSVCVDRETQYDPTGFS